MWYAQCMLPYQFPNMERSVHGDRVCTRFVNMKDLCSYDLFYFQTFGILFNILNSGNFMVKISGNIIFTFQTLEGNIQIQSITFVVSQDDNLLIPF